MSQIISGRRKLFLCLVLNVFILISVIVIVSVLGDPASSYLNFGPNNNLTIFSVRIDTWAKYVFAILMVIGMQTSYVFIELIGLPILNSTIYNTDKININEDVEFKRRELYLYANSMYMMFSLRNIISVFITISQIDIASCNLLTSLVASLFITRNLLKYKSFTRNVNFESPENFIVG